MLTTTFQSWRSCMKHIVKEQGNEQLFKMDNAWWPHSLHGVPWGCWGKGPLKIRTLRGMETVSDRPVLVAEGLEKVKMMTPANNNNICHVLAGKSASCSVLSAPPTFIWMTDLGFLWTTEYTGYSCPSNKHPTSSRSWGKEKVIMKWWHTLINWESLQASKTIRNVGCFEHDAIKWIKSNKFK